MIEPDRIFSSGAAVLIETLNDLGVGEVYANAGTDFAPIIEALSAYKASDKTAPEYVVVPHETVALAMGHGQYAISGETPVAMVHTTVGSANAAMGVINAARDHVPMVLLAGRTPLSDHGSEASRSGHIHWGQESFDQAGMFREYLKWDYEVRGGQSIRDVIIRAYQIANNHPKGPVYVTLPRELLAGPSVESLQSNVAAPVALNAPLEAELQQIADTLIKAKSPLILSSFVGQNPEAAEHLASLAERLAIPVVQPFCRYVGLPTSHPMHAGYSPKGWLEEADAVVVIDSETPWIPRYMQPRPDAEIIHMSADPIFQNLPLRSYPSSLNVAGDTCAGLKRLNEILDTRDLPDVEARRSSVEERINDTRKNLTDRIAELDGATPVAPSWLGKTIAEHLPENAFVINELGVPLDALSFPKSNSLLSAGLAGGLGMGIGAAVGAKKAAPDRFVTAIVGNGCYMFGAPVAAHFTAQSQGAPILVIVQNNGRWQQVDESTRAVYPDGYAAKAGLDMPITSLDPSPDFSMVAKAAGAWAKRVTSSAELPAALEEAIQVVASGRQALLDVETGVAGPRQG